ncbi:hypothetical protein [Metabacillus litoralis]|uniref:Uncharacterized protein n=1 Tax=Metabacillus litoralis TaxID=152268 RepID=A0A179SUP4_9BACI|nr:hypothetical protein [Metabacillus litoralis]OAS85114.1 hypothetical protein A6K24_06275 [Metabacillus litoralis]
MDYKKVLEELRVELNGLEENEQIKSPLLKVEQVLSQLYSDILDKEEDEIRLRINDYIEKRRKEIPINKVPVNLEDEATLLIHIIPFNSFKHEASKPNINLDLQNRNNYELSPLYCGGWNPGVNENGLFSYASQYGYLEIETSGIVEFVDQGMLSHNPIASGVFEKTILEGLERAQGILKQTDVEGKLLISISLLGIKGFTLPARDNLGFTSNSAPFEREDLHLPQITLDSINDSIEAAIKPAFDQLWRAFGYSFSHNYRDGEFVR